MKKDEIIDQFSEFLRENYYKDLAIAMTEGKKSFEVDFFLLDKFNPDLADTILERPEETLALLEKSVEQIDVPQKGEIHIRFFNAPENSQIRIRNIRAEHIGKFLSVDGIVKRASEVRPEIAEIVFECQECGNRMSVIQTEKDKIVRYPARCDCGNRRGFRVVKEKLYDARWVSIEEPFEITTGERPSNIMVYLKEDLVSPKMRNKTEPGNRIKVVGILKEVPRRTQRGRKSRQMEILIDANNVEAVETEWEELVITPEDERMIKKFARDKEIYDKLVFSLAPTMYGLDKIKLAIVLQLFGGVPHLLKDGTRIRGDIHLLLIGDPAVGKSQILKLATEMIPRGRYVSGKGVTGAGLCIKGDSLVCLGDGSLIKIEDLVNEELSKGYRKIESGIIVAKKPTKRKILSFDIKTLKLKPLVISQYWKIPSPSRLIRIATRTGRSIECTMDNPIPIIKNAEIVWKKAKDLVTGDYIATPRISPSPTNQERFSIDFIEKTAHLVNSSSVVNSVIKEVWKTTTLRDYAKKLGIDEGSLYYNWRDDSRKGSPSIGTIIKMSRDTGLNLNSTLPDKLILTQYHGNKISIPRTLTKDFMYLMGLLAGDGSITKTKFGGFDIKFTNSDSELLNIFKDTCISQLNLEPSLEIYGNKIPYMRFHSKIVGNILKKFGIPDGKKSHNLQINEQMSKLPNDLLSSYLQGLFDADGSVTERKTKGSNGVELYSVSKEFIKGIQILLLRFEIISRIRKRRRRVSKIRGKEVHSSKKWVLEIKGLRNFKIFKEKINFRYSEKSRKLNRIINKSSREHTNIDVVPEIGKLLRDARESIGISAKKLYGFKNYSYEKGRRNPSKRRIKELAEKFTAFGSSEEIENVKMFAYSDIFWDIVKKIEIFDNNTDEFVYDLTVEGGHSFVANGLIIHNTAAVVRDEQFLGGWILEAGALVLSSNSVIGIDEFEKIEKTDQVAMHEAMSLQSISIAKASIVATLPARTAVLAGANPKLGRFDPYIPIREQIDIPQTLLSRFDVKFALRDVPSVELDEKMVDHVLKARHFEPEGTKPFISPEFLRKYIAYAKVNCNPVLTEEAGKKLKEFYVGLRAKTSGEEAPVPITLRQYEALIRLAEASARVQLQDKVRIEDADRAIDIMKHSLRQFGFDPETGMIDIDRAEGVTTSAQRSKIRIVLDILDELHEAIGKTIPTEEIIKRAKDEGVDDIEDILKRMKREGMVFEPRPRFIQKV